LTPDELKNHDECEWKGPCLPRAECNKRAIGRLVIFLLTPMVCQSDESKPKGPCFRLYHRAAAERKMRVQEVPGVRPGGGKDVTDVSTSKCARKPMAKRTRRPMAKRTRAFSLQFKWKYSQGSTRQCWRTVSGKPAHKLRNDD